MKRKLEVVLFLLGFFIGLNCIFKNDESSVIFENGLEARAVDNEISSYQKIRILCFIGTSAKNFRTRAIHVRETWAKHCDKLIFASNTSDERLGSISLNVSDEYYHLWDKIKETLRYIHENYIDDYEWCVFFHVIFA